MLILVQIDLVEADLELFDRYEEQALTLLASHKAELRFRVRSSDNTSETHLLSFEDRASFESFLADPAREELQPLWLSCKAKTQVSEVLDLT